MNAFSKTSGKKVRQCWFSKPYAKVKKNLTETRDHNLAVLRKTYDELMTYDKVTKR